MTSRQYRSVFRKIDSLKKNRDALENLLKTRSKDRTRCNSLLLLRLIHMNKGFDFPIYLVCDRMEALDNKTLTELACESHADCVKFQIYTGEHHSAQANDSDAAFSVAASYDVDNEHDVADFVSSVLAPDGNSWVS